MYCWMRANTVYDVRIYRSNAGIFSEDARDLHLLK